MEGSEVAAVAAVAAVASGIAAAETDGLVLAGTEEENFAE